MTAVPLWRLYVMRGAYAFIAVGLALMIWSLLLFKVTPELEHMRGVVWALLGAVGLLAVLGIRYPLQMLPLLFFELTWKTIWLIVIGIPLRSAGAFDAAYASSWIDCIAGIVLCVIAIPWRYAFENYVRRPGDPWRRRAATNAVHREPTPLRAG